jgi:amidohydrolase
MTHPGQTIATFAILFSLTAPASHAQTPKAAPGKGSVASAALDALHQRIDSASEQLLPRVTAWRRDLHQHPELGNREVRTSKIMADHLRALGLDVRTGVGKTGVVGVLRGGKPGPVVALRSDMDALPIAEETGLPFASTVRTDFNGRDVGVMHACGHDYHMSMLMGAAEVLAGLKADLPGTVVFIFQPAEEGAPAGEEGGASLMIKEGALDNPKVDAIFGLHVFPRALGSIEYRPRGMMAASDSFTIVVRGRGAHGAMPASGIDPIVVSSQIVMGIQSIVSRQIDLTTAPAVITVGAIEGGNRFNIIPDTVKLMGTIRTFDEEMRQQIHARLKRTAEQIAASAGALAEISIEPANPVTWNDQALADRMAPSLKRVAGNRFNANGQPTAGAEDFAWYQKKVPGLFFFLGVAPEGADLSTIPVNHSSKFSPDEGALVTGVRALASVAVDYLTGKQAP